jgi:hypothetical protein
MNATFAAREAYLLYTEGTSEYSADEDEKAKSGYTMGYTFIFEITQLVSSQAMSTIE